MTTTDVFKLLLKILNSQRNKQLKNKSNNRVRVNGMRCSCKPHAVYNRVRVNLMPFTRTR